MKFSRIQNLPKSSKLILVNLFDSDRALSLKELANKISLSPRTISYGIKKLKELELVTKLLFFKDMRTCSFYIPKIKRSWIQSIVGNDLFDSLQLKPIPIMN